jgi:hypothetical protein
MPIALDELQTAIWIYDIDHYSIVWANQGALNLWDSSSIEALKEKRFKNRNVASSKRPLTLISSSI